MNDNERIRTRADLPKRERAVSDALDEYLIRLHGILSGWSSPYEFIEWLEKRGYTIVEFVQGGVKL